MGVGDGVRRDGEDGPVVTGDPEIDKLERELWQRTRTGA